MGSLQDANVTDFGTHVLIAASTKEGAKPVGNTQAYDDTGAPYTSQTGDPVYADVAFSGAPANLRENYKIRLRIHIEDRYREDAFRPLSVLQRPAEPSSAVQQDFIFRFEELIAPWLGFTLPAIDEARMIWDGLSVRKAFVEFWEFYGDGSQSGKIFEDTSESPRFEFYVFNAAFDQFEGLLKRPTTNNCPDSGYDEAYQINAYTASSLFGFWMTKNYRKQTAPNALEYLSFFSNSQIPWLEDAVNNNSLALIATVSLLDGTEFLLHTSFDWTDYVACEELSSRLNHVWILPVHNIWQAITDAGIDHKNVDHLCITLGIAEEQGLESIQTTGDSAFTGSVIPGAGQSDSDAYIVQGTGFSNAEFAVDTEQIVYLDSGQEAEISANVFVHGNAEAAQGGEIIKIDTSEVSGADIIEETVYDWASDPVGAWVNVSSRIRANQRSTISVRLKSGLISESNGGGDIISLDNPTIRLTGVIFPVRYDVNHDCQEFTTFCFQNSLGVPETYHAQAPRKGESALRVERSSAEAVLNRLDEYRGEDHQRLSIQQQPEPLQSAVSFPLEHWEHNAIKELLTSEHVYVLHTTPADYGCFELTAESEWRPILWETDEAELYAPDDQRPLLDLVWRLSRRPH
jgi:hypothetical protein